MYAYAGVNGYVDGCADHKHAMEIEQHLKLPVVRHRVKKPGCLEEVLEHFNRNTTGNTGGVKLKADDLVIVGDRVLTDIAFGNLCGMLTVLVDPFTSEGDNRAAAILRSFEKGTILPYLQRNNVRPPAHKAIDQLH